MKTIIIILIAIVLYQSIGTEEFYQNGIREGHYRCSKNIETILIKSGALKRWENTQKK